MHLVAGLTAALLVRGWRDAPLFAVTGLALSVVWGVIVGVNDARLATFVGGTGLAAANVAVGAVAGLLIGAAVRLARPDPPAV